MNGSCPGRLPNIDYTSTHHGLVVSIIAFITIGGDLNHYSSSCSPPGNVTMIVIGDLSRCKDGVRHYLKIITAGERWRDSLPEFLMRVKHYWLSYGL